MVQKPELLENDIWAAGAANANKAKPQQSKISSGWVYGEKPPHNEFNWWWELVGKMLVHIQQHGNAEWEEHTIYETGALAWYDNNIWKWTLSPDNNVVPADGSGWETIPTSISITDIYDELNNLRHIINNLICTVGLLENKHVLVQTSWNGTVLQLDSVDIGDITTDCDSLSDLTPPE